MIKWFIKSNGAGSSNAFSLVNLKVRWPRKWGAKVTTKFSVIMPKL